MRKLLWFLLFAALVAVFAHDGQAQPVPSFATGTGAPTGNCGTPGMRFYTDKSTGNFYTCTASGWVEAGGGGSGAVNSVTGTTNQMVCTPTTGNVVCSYANPATFPGNLGTLGTMTVGTSGTAGSIGFYDSGGTNETLWSEAATGYNGTWYWPTTAGSTGNVFTLGSAGQVSWSAPASTTVNGATCTPGSSCNANYVSGSVTNLHVAQFTGTGGELIDGGALPVSPTTNQNIRTIGTSLTPSSPTGCVYVAFAGTITAFHSNTVDGATNSTVLIKVETQATRATFLSTGVSGASDISNGGEQLTSVLGVDDVTLTSWTKTVAAGTTFCFVASGFSLGSSVNANINVAAN